MFTAKETISIETPNRKRSKKDRACDLCRRKKIRCDYDSTYPHNPCTSCKSYNKICAFKEAAKKRGPPKGYVEGLESRLKRMEKLLMNIASNGNVAPENTNNNQDSDSAAGDASESDASTEEKPLLRDNSPTTETIPIEKEPFSYVGSSSGIYLLSRLFPNENTCFHPDANEVPHRALEGHEDDLMIARYSSNTREKHIGSPKSLQTDWKLPPKELVDHLIDIYFKRINIILPILDKEQFYESYEKKEYGKTFIPIIVAVCRITCRLLKKDDPLVKKYKIDRASLFHDLEKQLDTKFDLDFLEPKIETMQVLLLNASNASKWGLQSTDWIITSIAVKMAQDLGLHRANAQHEPKKDTEAKKRLWWSAYVIDRVVCASLGRPLTISDADCDVDYPDPEDTRYSLFIHLVKIACILGDILRALCSPRARIISEKGPGLENVSRNLENMLLEWKRSLPDHLNLTKDELYRISRKEINPALEKKINNGAGKLQFFYCAVYLLSKRPFISMGTGNDSNVKMPIDCQEALRISVDLFDVMETTSLLCFWSLSCYCLAQTQMLLFLNYRNIDAALIAESKTLSERFQERHQSLEDYITEKSLVPFLSLLSKVIMGEEDTSSEDIIDQQASLWGASNGIEWQEMVKLLSETGYHL